MTGLKVIAAGFAPTLQDFGRPAFQNRGVPVSGALDTVSLRIGNALVGNDAGMAAIEFRMIGPVLEVMADSIRVALVGTRAGIVVEAGERIELPAYQSIRLKRGHRFSVNPVTDSGAAYLCVAGGRSSRRIWQPLHLWSRPDRRI